MEQREDRADDREELHERRASHERGGAGRLTAFEGAKREEKRAGDEQVALVSVGGESDRRERDGEGDPFLAVVFDQRVDPGGGDDEVERRPDHRGEPPRNSGEGDKKKGEGRLYLK